MHAYFDSSALVPLLIAEPATARCTAVWNASAVVVSSAIAYVEVHAALAQASRLGRLTETSRATALDSFDSLWSDVAAIPVDSVIIRHAAQLSAEQALRGYDAVHCASAAAAASAEFLVVTGDRDLLRACGALGFATVDSSSAPRPIR